MVVRELVALLGVKSDKASFKKAESGMSKIVAVAKAAAVAFATVKLVQFVKGAVTEIAQLGDQFDKMAKRSGFAVDALQQFQHVAELSGASIENVETVIKKLQQSQVEAADGVAEYGDEFKRLGLDVKEADGTLVDTQELFFRMADAMNNLETDAERTAVAMRLLGRGGTALIPFFKEGTDGIKEMMKELKDLGGLMSNELVQASADYIDNQQRMTLVTRGLQIAIAKELLPIINKNTDAFIAWWKINGAIIRQRVGEAFSILVKTLKGAVSGAVGLVRLFVKIFKNLSGIPKAVFAIGIAIMALGKIIKMGPIGKILILIALLALIIDDFQTWREGGKSVIGDLVKALDEMLDIDVVAWVEEAIKVFTNLWGGIKAGAGAVIQSLLAIGKLLITMWSDPEKAWKEFTYEMQLIWKELWDWVKADGYRIVDWFTEFLIAPIAGTFEGLFYVASTWLENLFTMIVGWATKTTEAITSPFKKAHKFISSLLGEGKEVKIKAIADLPEIKGLTAGLDLGTRAQAPARIRGRAGERGVQGAMTNSQNTDIKINVNAAPGMSENKVAQLVAKQVSQSMNKQNRAAVKALTPATAGGV
jgi:hypothetical protein